MNCPEVTDKACRLPAFFIHIAIRSDGIVEAIDLRDGDPPPGRRHREL